MSKWGFGVPNNPITEAQEIAGHTIIYSGYVTAIPEQGVNDAEIDVAGIKSSDIALVTPASDTALVLMSHLYAVCEKDMIRCNFDEAVNPDGTEVFSLVVIRRIV